VKWALSDRSEDTLERRRRSQQGIRAEPGCR
jgi:hypothetical protein